jgi:hypothetical protein
MLNDQTGSAQRLIRSASAGRSHSEASLRRPTHPNVKERGVLRGQGRTRERLRSVINRCQQFNGELDNKRHRSELPLAYRDPFPLKHLSELLPD